MFRIFTRSLWATIAVVVIVAIVVVVLLALRVFVVSPPTAQPTPAETATAAESETATLLPQAKLEYDSKLVPPPNHHEEIRRQAAELLDEFYAKTYQYKLDNPSSTYLEAIRSSLPTIVTLPTQPITLTTIIRNTGNLTATQILLDVELDRPIDDLRVNEQRPERVIDGQLGMNKIKIEIPEILSGKTVTVTALSTHVIDSNQLDKLILCPPVAQLDVIEQCQTTDQMRNSVLAPLNLKEDGDYLPLLIFVHRDPSFTVYVTSAEGEVGILVRMTQGAFRPPSLRVSAGTNVTWINNEGAGGESYSVTSGVGGTPNGLFDSGLIQPGGTFSFTFTTPGTYAYYSITNPTGMTGEIIVTP